MVRRPQKEREFLKIPTTSHSLHAGVMAPAGSLSNASLATRRSLDIDLTAKCTSHCACNAPAGMNMWSGGFNMQERDMGIFMDRAEDR
jgi:hypothetical protein